ncbi:MAG: hypothetical protein RIS70_1148 [Planctomycetota bacterium]
MQRNSIFLVAMFALGLFSVRALCVEPPSKAMVPNEDIQKSAAAQIGEIYKPDYAKAKTSVQKLELARKLLKEGHGTKDDLVARFVLMRIVRDIATQQGDLAIAFEAIDLIESDYEVDAMVMRFDAGTTAVKAAKTPIASRLCVDLLRPLIDQLTTSDRYDDAKQISELAVTAARGTRDTALVKEVTSQAKELESIATSYRKVKEYQTRLATKATDPEANFELGKFFCFVKGDWERGVPMLAIGSDEQLSNLARTEIEEEIDFLKTGDRWWDYGETLPVIGQRAVRRHAAALYTKAQPTLSGLNKKKVDQRLQAIQAPPYGKPVVNSIGMELKLLPAGKFMMGSANGNPDETRHEVTLSKPFYLGVYLVTEEQYALVMGTNPSEHKGPKNPVTNVSWEDAVEFCRRLSEVPKERAAGREYRLPTEAEWEYACRAGTTTEYSFGDNPTPLAEYAWLKDNAGGHSNPVGQKKSSPWGFYDMYGNVWEWCADWYGEYPVGAVADPSGAATGSNRVYRGGSWLDGPSLCRSAARLSNIPSARFGSLGFRVAMSPKSPEATRE